MSPRAQKLVNAQIEINRAVFEANKEKPDDKYILVRILQAQADLYEALSPNQGK